MTKTNVNLNQDTGRVLNRNVRRTLQKLRMGLNNSSFYFKIELFYRDFEWPQESENYGAPERHAESIGARCAVDLIDSMKFGVGDLIRRPSIRPLLQQTR